MTVYSFFKYFFSVYCAECEKFNSSSQESNAKNHLSTYSRWVFTSIKFVNFVISEIDYILLRNFFLMKFSFSRDFLSITLFKKFNYLILFLPITAWILVHWPPDLHRLLRRVMSHAWFPRWILNVIISNWLLELNVPRCPTLMRVT